MAQPRVNVSIDGAEFEKTRDAIVVALMNYGQYIDKITKAYLEHTNLVLAGGADLDVHALTEPMRTIASASKVVGSIAPALDTVATSGPLAEVLEDAKKRKRAAKDPNAPKRPLTAYFRFLNEVRPQIQDVLSKDPNATRTQGDLAKIATTRWNELPDKLKKPYKDAYLRDVDAYDIAVREYRIKNGLSVEELDKKKKVKALLDAPATAAANVDDVDDDSETEEEVAAPPPKSAKKAASPEAVKKTPKAAAKKASDDVPTPMFSSINNAVNGVTAALTPGNKKKRKSEAADGEQPVKKKVGRPSKAKEVAAAEPADSAVETQTPKGKKKKKTAATDDA